MFHVYNRLLISPSFWLLSLLIIITALMPDYSIQAFNAFGCQFHKIFPGTGIIPEKLKQRFKSNSNVNNNDTSFNNYNGNNLETVRVQTTQL